MLAAQRHVSSGEPLAAGGLPRAQVIEIQRSRLLAAAARTVEELGYTQTTVAHITTRARVSRRTFYDLFANREECMVAVFDDLIGTLEGELGAAGLEGLGWRERVRRGLWTILALFDREPALARICVVQALRGETAVLERRDLILGRLATVVDEGRLQGTREVTLTPLVAEGLVGAAFAIVYGRLLRGDRRPLSSLLGELMGMIVLPYQGAAAARREQARRTPGEMRASGRRAQDAGRIAQAVSDPLEGVAMRLTYRTARVLEGIAGHPAASNREVAERAGIHDQGQVSKLLARLERIGLLANSGAGHAKGEPNAWTLTPRGEMVARSICIHASHQREASW